MWFLILPLLTVSDARCPQKIICQRCAVVIVKIEIPEERRRPEHDGRLSCRSPAPLRRTTSGETWERPDVAGGLQRDEVEIKQLRTERMPRRTINPSSHVANVMTS